MNYAENAIRIKNTLHLRNSKFNEKLLHKLRFVAGIISYELSVQVPYSN